MDPEATEVSVVTDLSAMPTMSPLLSPGAQMLFAGPLPNEQVTPFTSLKATSKMSIVVCETCPRNSANLLL